MQKLIFVMLDFPMVGKDTSYFFLFQPHNERKIDFTLSPFRLFVICPKIILT